MSPESFLPLMALLVLETGEAPLCKINAVNDGGIYRVTADVQPVATGTLTYRINATVVTGTSRSQSINGGAVELIAGTEPITIWQGRLGGNVTSRITIRLDGSINDTIFACEANLP